MEKKKEAFKKFVLEGIQSNYCVGLGNPLSDILFIGKEANFDNVDIGLNDLGTANNWQPYINNPEQHHITKPYEVNVGDPLRKGWGKNTWSKYQKLKDYIFCENTENFYINFVEKVFTTELNDNPSKNTKDAKKDGLVERKEIFKQSDFIQSFPVVVLACSDYIKNNEKIREIDNLFDVTYDEESTNKYSSNNEYTTGNWFYVHYNKDKTKLVIHTRQLSTNVEDRLLEDIGTIIREFRNNINPKTK